MTRLPVCPPQYGRHHAPRQEEVCTNDQLRRRGRYSRIGNGHRRRVGVVGLTAARVVWIEGLDVAVLERRDRTAGRTDTMEVDGPLVDEDEVAVREFRALSVAETRDEA
ncbi:uncharacterized protein METZ01_LOCUS234258 [marine metagenome]|uniref:Uncharacterized protein n=1 Tax=marine metagenome TaxID=408172 RepID=A0A382H2D9_9ZZZZ